MRDETDETARLVPHDRLVFPSWAKRILGSGISTKTLCVRKNSEGVICVVAESGVNESVVYMSEAPVGML